MCKVALTPTADQWKGMQIGTRSRPIDNCKLCDSRLCCICIPIVQPVVVRGRLSVSPQGLLNAWGSVEKPLRLFCVHCGPGASVVVSVSPPGCLGWSLETSLHPFTPGLPLLLMSSFLPDVIIRSSLTKSLFGGAIQSIEHFNQMQPLKV